MKRKCKLEYNNYTEKKHSIETSATFSFRLPVGRWAHPDRAVCFLPGLPLLPATPAGWASGRSCCCGTASGSRSGRSYSGTGLPRPVALDWPVPCPHQLVLHLQNKERVQKISLPTTKELAHLPIFIVTD